MTDEFIIDFATKMFFLKSISHTFSALGIFDEDLKKKLVKVTKKNKLYKKTHKELQQGLDTKDVLKRDHILKSVYMLHQACVITSDNNNANKSAELLIREANAIEGVLNTSDTGTTITVIRDDSHVKS